MKTINEKYKRKLAWNVKNHQRNGVLLVCLHNYYVQACKAAPDGKYKELDWIEENERICAAIFDGEEFFIHEYEIGKAADLLIDLGYLVYTKEADGTVITIGAPFDLCDEAHYKRVLGKEATDHKLPSFTD